MNPFEQFVIMIINAITMGPIELSLTNNSILLINISIILIIIHYIILLTYKIIPNNYQQSIEFIYQFILTIVKEQVSHLGYKYFPHFYSIFLLILMYNIVGLIPFSYTTTSQIVITLSIAFAYFIAWIIIGIITLNKNFIYIFCPKNMPSWLLPLLVCVEFLSFCLRPVSLGIRLFANMLAGHILLHILANASLYLSRLFGIRLFATFHDLPHILRKLDLSLINGFNSPGSDKDITISIEELLYLETLTQEQIHNAIMCKKQLTSIGIGIKGWEELWNIANSNHNKLDLKLRQIHIDTLQAYFLVKFIIP